MTETKLNLEELDNVAGGNPNEFNQLAEAFIADGDTDWLTQFGTHMPLLNNFAAVVAESILNKKYGIKAIINVGVLGSGFNARPNSYTDKATGRTLTHLEVLSIIQSRG